MHILRLVLLGLTACIALILGWSFLQQATRMDASQTPEIADVSPSRSEPKPQTGQPSAAEIAAGRRIVEAKFTEAPDYLRFLDRLKLLFPGEYEAVLDTVAKRSLAGGENGNVDLLMSEAVRALRLSRGVLAAKADSPALGHVFEMQLAMMKALAAKDQRLCVDFLYGGASRAFFQFSAANRTLMADMAIAGLDAISDGQIKKIDRPAPSDADFQLLEKALSAKGLGKSEIEALLDGKIADPPIEDDRMCRVGQIYLETLAGLPELPRLRIYGLAVELMARS